jgi:hypothetical protein
VQRLCWEDGPRETARDSLEQRLLARLDRAITPLFQGELCQADPVVNLPAAAKERVILHPYVAGFACGRLPLDWRQVQFHVSEALLETISLGSSDNQAARRPCDSSTTTGILYDDSLALPSLADGRSWLSTYEASDFLSLKANIDAALLNVSLVNESAFHFIHNYMRYVSIRRNIEKPDRFGTYTFPMLPGLLVICNSEVDTVDLFLIEETLIHEAIHCFLDWVEGEGPSILRVEYPDFKVTSPWTGNPLDVATAFHATLVWFGLGEYFKKCIAAGLSEAHKSRFHSRLDFVNRGFKAESFLTLVDFLHQACNPGPSNVLDLIAIRCA